MKKKIITAAVILLSVLLLLLGWLAVTGGRSILVPDESLYRRAKVVDIRKEVDLGEETQVPFFAEFREKGEGHKVLATWSYSGYTSFNPRPISLGDSVVIVSYDGGDSWHFVQHVRSDVLIVLLLVFFAALIVFGRSKGVKTVVSLTLTVFAVFLVFIPAVMTGRNIYLWSVLVCVYITVMTLCIVNGVGPMSLSAIFGCSGGVLVSLLITVISDSFMHLTGHIGDEAVYLAAMSSDFDLLGLIYGSIIIGSVGAVMDVAVDISASLKELTVKLGGANARTLFRSGLNIGRDVIGTMSNTLVLAYIGGSMGSVILFIYNFGTSPIQLFNYESLVVEILHILVGSLGILFTLPLTSAICAFIYSRPGMLSRLEADTESGEAVDEYTYQIEQAAEKY